MTSKRSSRGGGRAAAAAGRPEPIPIQKIRFDASNPRIAERLGGGATQRQIEQLLLTGEMKARELVPSFMENGFIPYEPLIVRPAGAEFVAVEGNRRLAALRSMRDSKDLEERAAFERHQLDTVPCLVFTGDDRQLLAYLGLRHLSKTKDWSTSAKGAFVERVLKAGHSLSEAARLTNTSTNALRLILLTRRLFERAGTLGLEVPQVGTDGETFFWHLGDAVRRTRTKTYLRLEEDPNPLSQPVVDETRFEHLVTWLYGNSKTKRQRIVQSIRDIPDLDKCLGDDRSISALENGFSLEEAQEELQAAGATIQGHLERARKSVERACGGPWSNLDAAGLDQVRGSWRLLSDAIPQVQTFIDAHAKRLGG
jgi:hypothetical protein